MVTKKKLLLFSLFLMVVGQGFAWKPENIYNLVPELVIGWPSHLPVQNKIDAWCMDFGESRAQDVKKILFNKKTFDAWLSAFGQLSKQFDFVILDEAAETILASSSLDFKKHVQKFNRICFKEIARGVILQKDCFVVRSRQRKELISKIMIKFVTWFLEQEKFESVERKENVSWDNESEIDDRPESPWSPREDELVGCGYWRYGLSLEALSREKHLSEERDEINFDNFNIKYFE